MTLGWPWPILRQGRIWLLRLFHGKSKNCGFFRLLQPVTWKLVLIEIMKVCEYWRSRSFLYHIFFRDCMLCALLGQYIRWAFTGPMVPWFIYRYILFLIFSFIKHSFGLLLKTTSLRWFTQYTLRSYYLPNVTYGVNHGYISEHKVTSIVHFANYRGKYGVGTFT